MKASGELLDFFEDFPVFAAVAELSPIWKEAKRVNEAAEKEVFGQKSARTAVPSTDSAEVSVGSHETLTCSLVSPVSAPGSPLPQPASKPAGPVQV